MKVVNEFIKNTCYAKILDYILIISAFVKMKHENKT